LKISTDIVRREARAATVGIDKRWVMAYNAALGEVSATPHPLFPVCYEWNATRALRETTGLQTLNAQLVHAQHDLVIHRSPRVDETLTTTPASLPRVSASRELSSPSVLLRMAQTASP
jgi:hypothetical protein